MRRLQSPRATSATLRAAGLLLDRRTFMSDLGSIIALTALATILPRRATAASEGWTVLRITEGGIDIDGKKGQAYGIRQADGTVGYVGTKG